MRPRRWPRPSRRGEDAARQDEGIGYFFFFADFLAAVVAAAGAAVGSVSGTLPVVTIWICRLTGEVGRAWSMNCSSPSPSDDSRLAEI
jgi:hypothetical protein